MRKVSTKERYTTINLEKGGGPCRMFDDIQRAFALQLEKNEKVKAFRVNVPIEPTEQLIDGWTPKESFMTDFVIEFENGEKAVREAVSRSQLSRVSVLDKLDFSCQYWAEKGIDDWGLVVEKQGDK